MRKGLVCTAGLGMAAAILFASIGMSSRERLDVVAVDPLGSISGTGAVEAIALSTEQLTSEASLIVIGRTTAVESRWIDPRNLGTFATIAVDQVLKGAAADSITVVTPGGVDANRRIPIAMTYPGAPTIDQDERVLLFLVDDADTAGAHAIVGYAQGKFSIVTDPAGQEMVSRSRVTLRLQSGPGVSHSTVQTVPLAEVTAAIQSLVQ